MTTSDLTIIGNAKRAYKLWCKEQKKPYFEISFTNSTITRGGIVLLRDNGGFVAAVQDNKVLHNG